MTLVTRSVSSPVGELLLVGDGERLHALHLTRPFPASPPPGAVADDRAFPEAVRQLDEWFAGRRRDFHLALELHGTTWQRRVWDVLLEIPFGETVTYGEVARRAGSPRSARAVGHAVGRNPVCIVVPCHRVVGAGGALGGYSGGIDNKRWLLAHERSGRPSFPTGR
ncbi:MAG TPA: methylated-DNA--[protein]-cysteine S-methyltransferase [Acidimicrobiales bacterium]|nr:methylated-DNA--[protein]-cysteine S-methyltransferase [Acidimicrobiales bacterium]